VRHIWGLSTWPPEALGEREEWCYAEKLGNVSLAGADKPQLEPMYMAGTCRLTFIHAGFIGWFKYCIWSPTGTAPRPLHHVGLLVRGSGGQAMMYALGNNENDSCVCFHDSCHPSHPYMHVRACLQHVTCVIHGNAYVGVLACSCASYS